jgi:hypothetical protein
MENLAQIVGLRNRGKKYDSDLNSANITQICVNKKLAQASTEEAGEQIFKYIV